MGRRFWPGPGRRTDAVLARLAKMGWDVASPRPEFRSRLRADLLRVHEDEKVAAGVPPQQRPEVRRPRPMIVRLRPVLIFAGLLGVMFVTGMRTYASVPGDLLYPVKRAAESTVLRLSVDGEDLGEREMKAARIRLAEVAALVGSSSPDRDTLLHTTLEDVASSTKAALRHVRKHEAARRFAREQHNLVEPLLPKLDEQNRDQAEAILSIVDTFTSGQH
ncbi:hypothetical protein J5X84_06645 [Streptosporangiaceae bacterium NEAU-GS5]|nr:hypothetical protein [Streptosporangiaceae bacterium NEAU-GS5]